MLSDRDYDLISGYLDDALTESERAEVESRLSSDAEFVTELNAIRRTVALVKSLPELTAPRDFRLTREQAAQIQRENIQMSWPSKRGARMSWPSKRAPIAFTRTLIPLMSAAASVVLVLVGFLSLVGGQVARTPAPDMASVAMLDTSAQTPTSTLTDMDSALELTNPAPVDADTTPSSLFIAPAVNGTTLPSGMGGAGGGNDIGDFTEDILHGLGGVADLFMPATAQSSEEGIDAMSAMMVEPEPTPSPEFDAAGAARSSQPPAPVYPQTMTDEAEASDFMFEALPTGTVVAFESMPAATQVTDLAAIPSLVVSEDTANAAGFEEIASSDMAATKQAEQGIGAISPLTGLLLLITGLALGVLTLLTRPRT